MKMISVSAGLIAACACSLFGFSAWAEEQAKTAPDDKPAKASPAPQDDDDSNVYVGAGLVISQNLGADRVDELSFIQKPDGSVYAQVRTKSNTNAGFVAEAHYGLQLPTTGRKIKDTVNGVLLCGPWALIKVPNGRCGPQVIASLNSEGQSLVSQVGIGWALSLPGKEGSGKMKDGFTLGFGVYANPKSKVIDYNIVEKGTYLLKPEYKQDVLDKKVDPLVERSIWGVYMMVSKVF